MKILLIGGSGHVGSAAKAALEAKHEVIAVGRSTDPSVDLTDARSIEKLFDQIGTVDAVISAFGSAPFKPAPELTAEDLQAAFDGKVLSQLNLARIALDHLTDGGSITLTTGILSTEPVPTGAAAALANGAVESFVMASAGELPRGIRINAVSPNVLESAPGYFDTFAGFTPVSDEAVGRAFVRTVEGIDTGRTFPVA